MKLRKIIARVVNLYYITRNRQFIEREDQFSSRKIVSEYRKEISRIKKMKGLNYPELWSIDENAALVLYSLVRRYKPELVIETGVANGLSTRLILCAMDRNGRGELHSVEIDRDVGTLIRGVDTARWHLHVGKPKKTLLKVIEGLGKIDLFLHDSDHSYENMLFELNAVYGKLGRNGVIVSDDVNWHGAFTDFASSVKKRPHIIAGRGTCIGVLLNGKDVS